MTRKRIHTHHYLILFHIKRNNFTDLKTKIIRLIFQGQLLRDDFRTLEYYGLQPGSVVHCHISNVPYTGVRQNEYEEAERVPTRRRSQRVEVQDETNENVAEEPADPPPQFADLLTDEATRRRTAQDRNVGQIYFLLSTMLPILSGIGLAFFRPDRLRDLFRPTTLLTISHWLCNLLVDSGFLDLGEEEDNESSLQTSTIFLIFGGQMFAAGVFFYYFPQTFDRFGYYVLSVMMLYFIFVVYSRQRRRQPDVDAQNELIENQIVQERISLL
uniref:Ubiquitin-like domain-containing protein n=1 Tax=Caenorhabditis japonica TaxID=281687 RepID=A0A8R1IRE9_CAEJA